MTELEVMRVRWLRGMLAAAEEALAEVVREMPVEMPKYDPMDGKTRLTPEQAEALVGDIHWMIAQQEVLIEGVRQRVAALEGS